VSLKLLYIITIPEHGGAQVHLLDLVKHFNQDHELLVVTGSEGFLTESLTELGIAYQIEPKLVRPINPLRDVQAYRRFKEIFQNYRPDLVHCHSSKAGFIGRLAARAVNLPCVFTVHGWSFAEGMSANRVRAAKVLEQRVARMCDKHLLITVAESDRIYGLENGTAHADRTFTVHNGIPDINIRAEASSEFPVKGVMVARFSTQKDHKTLIEALSQMNGQVHVDLVGEGKSLDREKEYAKSLGADNKLSFLGNRNDVPKILASSNFFVLTTNWEGFPISILEAMRSGLPIIASDVGGVKEAVHDGVNGFLIPQKDVENS